MLAKQQLSFQQIITKKDVKDPHFEAISNKASISEINKQRILRRVKKIEDQLFKPNVNLDKLKEAVWTGIPKSKYNVIYLCSRAPPTLGSLVVTK